ncbi:HNH endonuclease family protein [Nocardia sp. NPDC050793]|uniref:HNH endonuclease family protein n=1 Tax=Nocardia sp. NPDC050793 TaxID=3155159 RepID=UPI0033DE4AE1
MILQAALGELQTEARIAADRPERVFGCATLIASPRGHACGSRIALHGTLFDQSVVPIHKLGRMSPHLTRSAAGLASACAPPILGHVKGLTVTCSAASDFMSFSISLHGQSVVARSMVFPDTVTSQCRIIHEPRSFQMTHKVMGIAAAVVAAALMMPGSGTASATPPNIPSKATAQSMLNGLTVAPEGSMSGYSRDLFPHWITISGNCNTRETVLMRDGTGVQVGGDCAPTAGSWYSPYDNTTLTSSSSVDIDHVVALAEAWRSGASSWTTQQRRDFANDLTNPQLIAVSASSNRSKGDQDPSQWLPTNASYRCTYTKMWIASKSAWQLSAQQTEKDTLQTQLNGCTS